MKRILTTLAMVFTIALLTASSCKQARLEPGGAYTTTVTNANGTVTTYGDLALYNADAAFKLAYDTLDLVFLTERNNRNFFWQLSPEIKHTLDKVRVEAQKVVNNYAAARVAYLASPNAAGMNGLQALLVQLQQLAYAANAAVAQAGQSLTNSPPVNLIK